MYIYHSTTTNPYVNIATEEHFLKNYSQDFFYLYINEPSVIVGKHQNTMAEVNIPYAIENNLKVVRRLSGGGTVVHDQGNLNYCFIKNGKEGHLVDFKKYSQPIIDTLQRNNVNAYLRGKSDLVINDLKFSGNAEHVFKNRILHHGTLLFSSNLDQLNEAIKVDWNNFSDKAVRSNRSKVTNVTDHLGEEMTIQNFKQEIINTVLSANQDYKEFEMSRNDENSISDLIEKKYKTWKWNFAYSPKYVFEKTIDGIGVSLNIEKGIVVSCEIKFNDEVFTCKKELEHLIKGMPHDYNEIKYTLELKALDLPFSIKNLIKTLF